MDSPIPSQQEPRQAPYRGNQPFIAGVPPNLIPGAPPGTGFVISVFPDAKPVNAYEVLTSSGQDTRDTLSSIFFTVPFGFTLLIRQFTINLACEIDIGEDIPTTTSDGVSNFGARIDFFVNDVGAPGATQLITRELPFGSYDSDVYVIADQNNIVEMRVTGVDLSNIPSNAYGFLGGSIEWSGTLFTTQGVAPQFQPTNLRPIPVVRGA